MKKLITAAAAVVLMALSVAPAFALSVDSPIATTVPETVPDTTSSVTRNTEPYSPKTGSGDATAYAIIGISVLAGGSAAVALAKNSKKSK